MSRSVPFETPSARASSLMPIGRPPSAIARRTRAVLSTAGTGRRLPVLPAIRVLRMIRRPPATRSRPIDSPAPVGVALDPSETWRDEERRAAQWRRLQTHLSELAERNPFYRAKLGAAGIRDAREVRSIAELPFTTKAELSEDQAAHPPF